MKLLKIAFHRNGCVGVPFWAVIFKDGKDKLLGIKFDGEERCFVAVFNLKMLSEDNITFGENSFRGDWYDNFLQECINKESKK